MRLIDADALLRYAGNCYDEDDHLLYAVGTGTIMRMPTIDAVPVVRCKDCDQYEEIEGLGGWCNAFMHKTVPNHYCSYGERRTDETD